MIRALGIGGAPAAETETDEARRLVIQAALDHLAGLRDASDELAEVEEDIAHHYRQGLASLRSEQEAPDRERSERNARYLEISRELLNVERKSALHLRREGRISSEALRKIERDLDLGVIRLNITAAQKSAAIVLHIRDLTDI